MTYRIQLLELVPRSNQTWRRLGQNDFEFTEEQLRQFADNLGITLPARFQVASPDEPTAQELRR